MKPAFFFNSLSAALALTLASTGAGTAQNTTPRETATFQKSDLPGYELVVKNCQTCHSPEYVVTQPPASTRTYWDATIKKMKNPFGAFFPDEDIAPMVDYLVKTYGAERSRSAAPPVKK